MKANRLDHGTLRRLMVWSAIFAGSALEFGGVNGGVNEGVNMLRGAGGYFVKVTS